MKRKKTRYTLLNVIIRAANQVFKIEAGFIGDHKANQAKNNINHLFNVRKNALYATK